MNRVHRPDGNHHSGFTPLRYAAGVTHANLDGLFNPRSVALIGASERTHSVGVVTLDNLRSAGFGGELFLVNPRHTLIEGLPVYPDVRSLPATPDLAIIATPADQVAAIVADLAARGTKAAVIITAGFSELGAAGAALQQQVLAAAKPAGLRIVGPNCIGVIVPAIGLNASFAQVMPPSGDIAFLSQSGAMVTAVLDWAQPRRIGFSHIVSLGDMADVDFADALAYLTDEPTCRAIVLYVEGISNAPAFLAAARRAARTKPLLVLKVGRQAEGARVARSHTGALAGSDLVYEAAFRRVGMQRVDSLSELCDTLETLAFTDALAGDRLAIVTNGGGPGVVATDALIAAGGTLAELSPGTIAKLDAILPACWSRGNPIDLLGDTPAHGYGDVVKILRADAACDAVLVLNSPTATTDPSEAARATIDALAANGRVLPRNVYTAWLGEELAAPARRLFRQARVATYDTPEDAVQGFIGRVRYRHQQLLLDATASVVHDGPPRDAATVRAIVARTLAADREWLEAEDVATALAAYGIPTVRSCTADDPDGAAQAASSLTGPFALKIRSRDITHKSDVGGVALDLPGPDAVRDAALAMLTHIASTLPNARIDGFLIQEMAVRPHALELIAGLSVDRVFGPVVLFGHGGTAVELIGDTSLELPPLSPELAKAQMARTRVWRLLQGYRGAPPAAIDAIAGVLVAIGALALDHPAICELDINPLLADAAGVLAVDARIRLTNDQVKSAIL